MSALAVAGVDAVRGGRPKKGRTTETGRFLDFYENVGMRYAGSLTFDGKRQKIVKAKIAKNGKVNWKDKSVVRIERGWDYFVNILQFPEVAARIAEMRTLAGQRGWDITQGFTTGQGAELVRAGKEVTVDHTRMGEWTRIWNRYVPFMGASVSGKKSALDAFRRGPQRWLLTRGLVVSMSALVNWWRNKDEDWWTETKIRQRLPFDFVRIGDEVLRIPRAFEVDLVFSGLITEMADAAYREDPAGVREWFKAAFEEFTVAGSLETGINMDAIPPVVREGISQAQNYDFYWGSPIVSRTQQKLDASEQFGPYTTRVAIGIGDILGVSPRRTDHLVRGLFAGVGGDIMALAGRGAEADGADLPLIGGLWKEGDWEPSDFPVFGQAFLRRGGTAPGGDVSIDRLYERFGAMISERDRLGSSESRYHKNAFFALYDAVKAVQVVSEAMRLTNSREQRNELSVLRLNIARDAVSELDKGTIARRGGVYRQIQRSHTPGADGGTGDE
jgi:hypothetical protein